MTSPTARPLAVPADKGAVRLKAHPLRHQGTAKLYHFCYLVGWSDNARALLAMPPSLPYKNKLQLFISESV
jgi:hypothetical protein